MHTLIALKSPQLNKYYALHALAQGTQPLITNSATALQEQATQADILIIESPFPEGCDIESLKKAHPTLYILVISYKHDIKKLHDLAKAGIYGIINALNPIERTFQAITEHIHLIKKRRQEKRSHLRITPSTAQQNTSSISIPGINMKYHGKIIDISYQGLLCETEHIISDNIVFKGKVLKILFTLHKYRFNCSCLVISKQQKNIALTFLQTPTQMRNTLSEYIFQIIVPPQSGN